MKAALQDRYGPPDVVRVAEVPRPEPGDDQVLVRVHVASVNRADLDGLLPRPGFTRLFIGLRAPRDPHVGIDVAGVVEAVGSAVTRFKPGDAVFADLFGSGQGAFAEYVAARETRFLPIPPGMSFGTAATLPHSAILAIQGLRKRSGRTVGRGDKVLIDGASGNVGPFAVQIAKAWGAEVTGTCRTEKLDFVRSLGADHVIDFTKVDYTKTGERYDWILDTDSHHSVLACRRALKRNGVYVTLGGSSLPIFLAILVAPLVGKATGRSMGLMFWWKPFKAEDVATLVELIAAGRVTPAIDRRYPLEQVVEALNWVNDGHARGKVLVTLAPEGGVHATDVRGPAAQVR